MLSCRCACVTLLRCTVDVVMQVCMCDIVELYCGCCHAGVHV